MRTPRALFWLQLTLPAVDALELRARGQAFGQTMRERLSGRWVWYPAPSKGPRCVEVPAGHSADGLRALVYHWTREADGYVSWTCPKRPRRRGPGRPPLARCPLASRVRALRLAAPCYPGAELVGLDACDEGRPPWHLVWRGKLCKAASVAARCVGGAP